MLRARLGPVAQKIPTSLFRRGTVCPRSLNPFDTGTINGPRLLGHTVTNTSCYFSSKDGFLTSKLLIRSEKVLENF